MLFYSTINPKTLRLLKDLQNLDYLKDFILVGGTSLALQIGHRISIDLDLFSFEDINVSSIPEHIEGFGRIRIVNQNSKILNLFIDNIKVDFVSYRYDFLQPPLLRDKLKLASIQDIAAMKLAAITGKRIKERFY
jgi:hypothetical protein